MFFGAVFEWRIPDPTPKSSLLWSEDLIISRCSEIHVPKSLKLYSSHMKINEVPKLLSVEKE
jgi:hypothetical protein